MKEFKIDLAYLYAEITRLREMMGTKTFWALPPEKRMETIRGLTFAFAKAELKEGEEEKASTAFAAVTDEYALREGFHMAQQVDLRVAGG